MGKKNTEIRTFLGGVNSDDTPSFVGKDEAINAINVTTSNPYGDTLLGGGQDKGALRSIYPVANTNVNTLLAASSGTYTLLGKVANSRISAVFFFFYNSLGNHKIIRLNINGTATLFFSELFTTDGLGWTANMYISARMFGDYLIFTENVNGIRYLNTTKAYTISSVTKSMLSFVQEPPFAPLFVRRATDTSILSPIVQLNSYQFSIRIKNVDGFESVLSPYSVTMPPERESAIASNSFSGNVIDVSLNYAVSIESDWDTIDFIVRNVVDSTYFVIRTYEREVAADVAAVALHNSATAALSTRFNGVTRYAIDSNTAIKQAEAIPITSSHLEVQENRLLVANSLIGYDTPTVKPTNISIAVNSDLGVVPTVTAVRVYMITTKNYDLTEDEYPIYAGLFVWYDSDMYALPKEYSVLRMNGLYYLGLDNRDNTTYPYLPPTQINVESLIKMTDFIAGTLAGAFPEPFLYWESLSNSSNNGFNLAEGFMYKYGLIFARYVWELHEMGTDPTGSWRTGEDPATTPAGYNGFSRFYMAGSDQINIVASPLENTFNNSTTVFLPNSTISLGLRLYDSALRSCGDLKFAEVKIPPYNPFDRYLRDKITLSLVGDNFVPSWAKTYAITMSKNDLCTNFLNFAPSCIKVARTDKDGVIYVTSDFYNNIGSDEIYGIAVPLDSLNQYKLGYSYSQGDSLRLDFHYSSSYSYSAQIKAVIDGYAIMPAPTSNLLIGNLISSQYNILSSPRYDALIAAPLSNTQSLMGLNSRQRICYATIYIGQQTDISQYEVAAFGSCLDSGSGNKLENFFVGTNVASSIAIFGDCYTQKRTSNIGSYTGFSMTTNETTQNTFWITNFGRISPEDRVGQQLLSNQINWSNTGSLNTQLSGLNRFDSADYVLTNYNSGAINMLQGEVGDTGRSELLLIICRSGGYYTLLNQNLIRSTSGEATIAASSKFIDNIIEINGNPATSSPRSFVVTSDGVFWADTLNKQIVQFKGGQSISASDYKAKRLFNRLFKRVESEGVQVQVTGGFSALSNEYLVGVPTPNPTTRASLLTTTLENPLDFYYNKSYTYVFNSETNKWTSLIPKFREHITLNNFTYAWDVAAQRVYSLIDNSGNPEFDSLIVIPFNSEYDYVKSALALKLDASRPPDTVWIQTNVTTKFDLSVTGLGGSQVATVSDWVYREGDWYCSILRDRMSKLVGSTDADFQARNFNGTRVKGKTINVILIWGKDGGSFVANSCSLAYE